MANRSRIRPRTRVYDSNYNIGESYYRPALDRLDRKYSGRPTSPPRQTSLPRDLMDRHAEAFADEDLPTARRRAEKHITEDHMFDSRGGRTIGIRPRSSALNVEDGFDEEIANSLQRIQAKKKMASQMIDDVDMESTMNNLSARRMVARTEKLLDSVGLNEESARKMFDENVMIRRRAIKTTTENDDSRNMIKWTALKDKDEETTSAAAMRAKQSRARLVDLEDEMEAIAEKQAARERRLANLRALMAENAEENEAVQTAMKSARISSRVEKKTVMF